MIPTTPGSYEFKGLLEHLSHGLPPKAYPNWAFAEVERDGEGRLTARVFDSDGHYSQAFLIQFAGQWRHDSTTNA